MPAKLVTTDTTRLNPSYNSLTIAARASFGTGNSACRARHGREPEEHGNDSTPPCMSSKNLASDNDMR